jgi:hypothetical protein
MRTNFPQIGRSFLNLDRLLPWSTETLPIPILDKQLAAERGTVIVKTHTPHDLQPFQIEKELFDYVQALLGRSRIVYVYRDGRDVMVSLYHYMRHYDPNIRNVSFSDFIRMPNKFDSPTSTQLGSGRVEYWRSHVEGWLEQPGVQAISYEQLYGAYEVTIKRLADRLDMELGTSLQPVRPAVTRLHRAALRAATLLGYDRRSTAILPRKGVIGEWKQHFSEEDIEFFGRRAGRLLMELGYS